MISNSLSEHINFIDPNELNHSYPATFCNRFQKINMIKLDFRKIDRIENMF